MLVYSEPGFTRLLNFVRAQRAEKAGDVAIGKPKSWDAYQIEVGYIRAMDAVESEIARITGTEDNPTEKDI